VNKLTSRRRNRKLSRGSLNDMNNEIFDAVAEIADLKNNN